MSEVNYTICREENLEDLFVFINQHWKKEHILTKSRALFDWQHKNEKDDYNFVLALDESATILGILGFIPSSQFSLKLPPNDAWLAIWKVRDDITTPGIGISMLFYLQQEVLKSKLCSVGLSKSVIPLYKGLNFETGQLKHYVAINPFSTSSVCISSDKKKDCRVPKDEGGGCTIESLSLGVLQEKALSFDSTLFTTFPQKNTEYIINRYVNHPIYKYHIHGIRCEARFLALIVVREIVIDFAKIGRIIDFQGDISALELGRDALLALMREKDYEYLDFMCHGFDDLSLRGAGFIDLYQESDLVIPNYFEPVVMENIVIDYAHNAKGRPNFTIVKGDSDQDRPSLLRNL